MNNLTGPDASQHPASGFVTCFPRDEQPLRREAPAKHQLLRGQEFERIEPRSMRSLPPTGPMASPKTKSAEHSASPAKEPEAAEIPRQSGWALTKLHSVGNCSTASGASRSSRRLQPDTTKHALICHRRVQRLAPVVRTDKTNVTSRSLTGV